MNASFFKFVFRFPVMLLALLGLATPSRAAIFLTQEIVDVQSKEYAANFPVGFLYVHSAVRGWQGGSATYAVNDKTAITAAHVLAGDDGMGGGIDEVRFYTGPSVAGYTGFAYANAWYLHPDYQPSGITGSNFGDFDIAVVSLRTSIPGLDPAPLYVGPLSVGMEISAAGYGVAGTNATGEVDYELILRAGTNVISGFGGDGSASYSTLHPNFTMVRFDSGPFSSQTVYEWQSSHGDSGGGWFVGNALAAVDSFIYRQNSPGFVVGNSSGAVQVSLFSNWLNDMASTSVPEPSSFACVFLALLTGFATRRFRVARG